VAVHVSGTKCAATSVPNSSNVPLPGVDQNADEIAVPSTTPASAKASHFRTSGGCASDRSRSSR
jgi:hypothetical protein